MGMTNLDNREPEVEAKNVVMMGFSMIQTIRLVKNHLNL